MEHFKVRNKKQHKIEDTLLLIGLGGMGIDTVLQTKHAFCNRFYADEKSGVDKNLPPKTKFLAIDLDESAFKKTFKGTSLDEWKECISLYLFNSYLVKKYKYHWPFSTNTRQGSRFRLMYNAVKIVEHFRSVFRKLNQDTPAEMIRIYVISSLTGAMGSGSFLDIAYLLRYVLKDFSNSFSLEFIAFAPDLINTYYCVESEYCKDIHNSYAFAAFKELDYWMTPYLRTGEVEEEQYAVEYPGLGKVPWVEKVFDEVYLICARNLEGKIIANSYQTSLQCIVDFLLAIFERKDSIARFFEVKPAILHCMRKPLPEEYLYSSFWAGTDEKEQNQWLGILGHLLFQDLQNVFSKSESNPKPINFLSQVYNKEDIVSHFSSKLRSVLSHPEDLFSGKPPFDKKNIVENKNTLHEKKYEEWIDSIQDDVDITAVEIGKYLIDRFQNTASLLMKQNGLEVFCELLGTEHEGFEYELSWRIDRERSIILESEIKKEECRKLASEKFQLLKRSLGFFAWFKESVNGLFKRSAFQNYLISLEQLYLETKKKYYYIVILHALECLREYVEGTSKRITECIDVGKKIIWDFNRAYADIQAIREHNPNYALEFENKLKEDYANYINKEIFVNRVEKSLSDYILFSKGGCYESALDCILTTVQPEFDKYQNLFTMPSNYTKEYLFKFFLDSKALFFSDIGIDLDAITTEKLCVPNIYALKIFEKEHPRTNFIVDESVQGISLQTLITGLPLCNYGYLSVCEETYLKVIKDRHWGADVHLGLKIDLDIKDELQFDWVNLPSPMPWSADVSKAKERWKNNKELHDLLKKAEILGLLELYFDQKNIAKSRAFVWLLEEHNGDILSLNNNRRRIELVLGDQIEFRVEYFVAFYGMDEKFFVNTKEEGFREYVYYHMSKRPGLLERLKKQISIIEAQKYSVI